MDLYTGALSEPPLDGAIFGPLLSCLVSDQFMRIKLGDSHWYERKMGPQRLTKRKTSLRYLCMCVTLQLILPAAQLGEIYKTSLAAIICRNSDDIRRVRQHLMERHRLDGNPYVNCVDLEGYDFDFQRWSEANEAPQLHRASFSQATSLVRVFGVHNNTNATQVTVANS